MACRLVYNDVAELSVKLPPPPGLPEGCSTWEGVQHLIKCYVQCLKHLDDPKYPASKGEHVLRALIGKSPDVAERARNFVSACQSLSEQGSSFSPLMWTWWMLGFLQEKGVSLYAAKAVWSPKVNSRSLRRFFYDDVGATAWSGAPLWPAAASQLLALWRKVEARVRLLPEQEARAEWEKSLPQYLKLLERAHEQRAVISKRVSTQAERLDLGMWLAKDPNTYLRLNKRARILGTKG